MSTASCNLRIGWPTRLRWQNGPDLAGIRHAAALAKLPAEEHAACEQLWADVAAFLKKAETPANQESSDAKIGR
jgi:hypothetical protein